MKDPVLEIPYRASDAWLLLAVLTSARAEGATLDGIISAGDGINYAVFSFKELDGGLARLLAGELITIKDQLVLPTEKAMAMHDRLSGARTPVLTVLSGIERELNATPWTLTSETALPEADWSLSLFTEVDLERAYEAYKRRFSAAIRDKE